MTSLVADTLEPQAAAPRRDFQFGEWLRSDFTRGYVPEPKRDPDVVILLATALASHRVLHGPSLDSLVAEAPFPLLREVQLAAVPALVEDLHGDRRDVLLVLARALHTVETGEIVSKDPAAGLAANRVGADGAELLRAAARELRGEARVDWDRESKRVSALAQSLIAWIHRASAAPSNDCPTCGHVAELSCAERVLPLFDADETAVRGVRNAILRTRAYSVGESGAASEISKRLIMVKAANTAATPAGAAAARSLRQLRLLRVHGCPCAGCGCVRDKGRL